MIDKKFFYIDFYNLFFIDKENYGILFFIDKEMFKRIIKDNQNKLLQINVIKRDYTFNIELLKLNKIISFIGPRRVGKTFLMFQFIKELIKVGVYDIKQIVFIDFSIYKGSIINSDDIVQSYFDLGYDKQPIFLFDEIQDIENFETLILKLYSQNYQLFITGSNSKLLSKELVTEFRGRVYEYFVQPLCFNELLTFKNIKKESFYNTEKLGRLKNILNNSLNYGTFPEIVLINNEMLKIDILKTYYEIVFYKDLLERYKIDNEKVIRYLIKKIILGNTKNINLIKIFNELKSLNIKIGKNTIYNYYEYLKNIFLVDELSNFYNTKTKLYLYNFGFGYLFGFTENLGQNFENLVYREIKKKINKQIFYKQHLNEIDFYIKDLDLNIQVCYELNEINFDRETKVFLNKKNTGNNMLVYFNKMTDRYINNVRFVNFIEFSDLTF